jgi:REP-associated tyrosine transposase
MNKRGQRSIRLKGYDYSQTGGYFVTIATFGRDSLFGEIMDARMQVNTLGRIVQECWDAIPFHFPNTTLDAFCIMPNHNHGILFIHDDPCRGTRPSNSSDDFVGARYISPLPQKTPQQPSYGFKPGSLSAIVASFKAAVTRRAGRSLNSGNIWQRNYYEHILRDQADYERVAGYIRDNPITWEQDVENPSIESQYGGNHAT